LALSDLGRLGGTPTLAYFPQRADYLTMVPDIFNYAVTLAFPTWKQGNPRVSLWSRKLIQLSSTNPDIDVDEDEDTSLHIEGFYQFNSRIILRHAGAIWITAPDFNNDNDDIVIEQMNYLLSSLVDSSKNKKKMTSSPQLVKNSLRCRLNLTLTARSKATAGISLLVPLYA